MPQKKNKTKSDSYDRYKMRCFEDREKRFVNVQTYNISTRYLVYDPRSTSMQK